MNDQTNNLLKSEFQVREEFAAANNLSPRTVDRYRQEGLPWAKWGRRIYIHVPGSKEFLAGRVQRLNPKRASRNGEGR